MSSCGRGRTRDFCLAPLAAALTLICASASATPPGDRFGVAMPAARVPGDRSGVAALMRALHAVGVKPKPPAPVPATTTPVTSCADDNGSGTLRALIAGAGEGDTLDLSALTCSVVTLTQGAIPVMLDDLNVVGPAADKLAIDGAVADRVFVHYGGGTLSVAALTLRNGANLVSGYNVAGGACIVSGGFVKLNRSVVSGCVASGEGAYGGGILARGVILYTSTLSANAAIGSHPDTFTAAYGGGAFAYRGITVLYDSTVSGNRASFNSTDTHGSYDTGGGIFADNGGYALRSTIEGNYSFGTGGGIASHGGFFVTDSTISGNNAKAKAGGGIFVRLVDTMSVSNSTIAHNSALRGGGLYVSGMPQSLALQSTIVADDVATAGAADIATASTLTIVGANNLVMLADAAVSLPGDTLHAEPKLLALANHGGPTRTHALSVGSPAVDVGNNVANLTTDQRGAGFPRVLGAATDIGAYEGTVAPPVPTAVPMLSTWTLALLAGLLGGLAGRKRRGARVA